MDAPDTKPAPESPPEAPSHRIQTTDDLEVSAYLQAAEGTAHPEVSKGHPEVSKGHPEVSKGSPATPHPTPAKHPDTVVIIDFGSQYSMLIARRVRECNVYCELVPFDAPWERIERLNPKAIILSGGPASVYDEGAPQAPAYVFESGLPVLGVCYGMNLLAHQLGGVVTASPVREYGHAVIHLEPENPEPKNLEPKNVEPSSSSFPLPSSQESPSSIFHLPSSSLFEGLPSSLPVWMSHGDRIVELPPGFRSLAYSDNSPYAVIGNDRGIIGLQFHPEVVHTPQGKQLLENFLYKIAGCRPDWTPGNFITDSIVRIREQVGGGRVICALSGGVDSAVTAALVHRAVGEQLTCIFVDNGLLRREEPERVVETFQRHMNINLIHVHASARFLAALAGVTDPEAKRKIVGETFIRVFEEEEKRLTAVSYQPSGAKLSGSGLRGSEVLGSEVLGSPPTFIAQGTTYPDVIESGFVPSAAGATGAISTHHPSPTTQHPSPAAVIKTHHNVGGLPREMTFQLVEPLRYLFKDEVRQVGLALGLPEEMVFRQPFPGPGLAIRIIGEVTREKLDVLRACDWIVMQEVKRAAMYRELWQAFAVLTDTRSVGVMGDYRTYGHVVAIRAVTAEDAMTADWARLPYDLLARISSRIVNEVPAVNRVVYDITSKPPGTIEWE